MTITGVGRDGLLDMLHEADLEGCRLKRELRDAQHWRDTYLTNLTSTQARCTELHLQVCALRWKL